MNSRERARTAMNHRQPDRPPLFLWATPEVHETLNRHFGVSTEPDLLDAMDIDTRWLLVDFVGPERRTFPDGSRENEFGMRSRTVKNAFGAYDEPVFHPLAGAETPTDLDEMTWPRLDWWDYTSITREINVADRVEPRWLGVGYASLFERGWNLCGFQKMLMDIAINPEFVSALLDRLLEFYLEQTSRILAASGGRIDMVYIADDLGSQQNLLIAPAMWHQFLRERWRIFIETLRARHGAHLKFHFHSCGAVAELIPAFIEVGIDILNPVQPKAAGMLPEVLKARHGDRISFSGALDIQELLPKGTRKEVEQHAAHLASVLGRNGGYLAGPAHNVQPDTPLENILAMVDGFKNGGLA